MFLSVSSPDSLHRSRYAMTVDVNQVSVGSRTITVTNHTTAKVFTKNLNYSGPASVRATDRS
jgi:hypothetical protein